MGLFLQGVQIVIDIIKLELKINDVMKEKETVKTSDDFFKEGAMKMLEFINSHRYKPSLAKGYFINPFMEAAQSYEQMMVKFNKWLLDEEVYTTQK